MKNGCKFRGSSAAKARVSQANEYTIPFFGGCGGEAAMVQEGGSVYEASPPDNQGTALLDMVGPIGLWT